MHGLDYEIQARTGYHRIQCRGEYSAEALYWLIEEVFRKTGPSRSAVLIDMMNLTGNLDTLSRHELGIVVAEKLRLKRIAVVADKEKITKLGENTAFNRGANFLVTHDRKDALEWLLELDGNPL